MKVRERDMKKMLNKQARELDRQIYSMDTMKRGAEDKLKKEIAKGAKADAFAKKTYARQVLQCRKNVERYNLNKAKLKDMEYQIDGFLATMKMTSLFSKAGNIMGQVNKQMDIQGVTHTMAKFEEQFMRMGLTQEMIEDALDTGENIDIDEDAEKLIRDMELNVQTGQVKKQQQQQMQSEEDKLL